MRCGEVRVALDGLLVSVDGLLVAAEGAVDVSRSMAC